MFSLLALCLSSALNLCLVEQPPSLPFGVLVEGVSGTSFASCTVREVAPDFSCLPLPPVAGCAFLGGVVGGCFGLPCNGGVAGTSCWLFEIGGETPVEGNAFFYVFE